MSQEDAIKLWLEHSKLMWSRLQTIAVLEGGIIAGWYKIYEINNFNLGYPVLIIGSMLLLIIGLLIHRDSQYMHTFEEAAGDAFSNRPKPLLGLPGRILALVIVGILLLSNISLICYMLCIASNCHCIHGQHF